MNSQQAKEILSLYRPGTADADDPSFAEALKVCQEDPELKRWFDEHCTVYLAIRARFRQIEVPQGLKEQIVAERNVVAVPFWRRPVILAAAASLAIFAAVFSFLNQTGEDTSFAAYKDRMVGTALRNYGMALTTRDLDQVRTYLTHQGAPSNYVVPDGLQKSVLAGCAIEYWMGARVSMLCFDSGKPHRPGQSNDLWLFVADNNSLRDPPKSAVPAIAKLNRTTTATWTQGDKTYFLVADGDEQFLRKYL